MRIFWYLSPRTGRRICYCEPFPRVSEEREALIEFAKHMENRHHTPPWKLGGFRFKGVGRTSEGFEYADYVEGPTIQKGDSNVNTH